MNPSAAESPAFLLSPLARRVGLVVCILWLAWLLVGIFPITPLEGDEQGVIHGATSLASGDARYWNLRYLYEIQPGSYVVINRLAHLTRCSTEGVFAFLSAGGALLFAALTALLVQRLLHAPWPFVAAGVLLSQEIWAGAYYMNTTAVGGWLALLAVLLALRPLTVPRSVLVAILLAVAGWIRLIRQLAGEGMATLLISSDLPELLALSDRVIVMRAGEIAGELARAEATQEKVLSLALPPAAATAETCPCP